MRWSTDHNRIYGIHVKEKRASPVQKGVVEVLRSEEPRLFFAGDNELQWWMPLRRKDCLQELRDSRLAVGPEDRLAGR